MRSSIIRHDLVNIDELFKPMCANCKYFLREKTAIHNPENIMMSTCQKFLVNPQNSIHETPKDMKIKGDYRVKHPYSLLARLDITLCGLKGSYFEPANK
jgi:hypothetical protein